MQKSNLFEILHSGLIGTQKRSFEYLHDPLEPFIFFSSEGGDTSTLQLRTQRHKEGVQGRTHKRCEGYKGPEGKMQREKMHKKVQKIDCHPSHPCWLCTLCNAFAPFTHPLQPSCPACTPFMPLHHPYSVNVVKKSIDIHVPLVHIHNYLF